MNWKELKRRRAEYYRSRVDTYQPHPRSPYHRRRKRPWMPWYQWIFFNRYRWLNIALLIYFTIAILGAIFGPLF